MEACCACSRWDCFTRGSSSWTISPLIIRTIVMQVQMNFRSEFCGFLVEDNLSN